MKNLIILIVIAALAAVGYYVVWPNMQSNMQVQTVQDRVEGWLEAQKRGDEQTGLCMWAEGVAALDMTAMKGYTSQYDGFRRDHGFYDGISSYSVDSVDPPYANVTINGRHLRLRVEKGSVIRAE
jgi:hypothetical protein